MISSEYDASYDKNVWRAETRSRTEEAKIKIMPINFFDPASLTLSHEGASYFHMCLTLLLEKQRPWSECKISKRRLRVLVPLLGEKPCMFISVVRYVCLTAR